METLQFITGCNPELRFFAALGCALEGGCRWVQYRDKEIPPSALDDYLPTALNACREYNARCIVNDYVDLAQHCHADGVHLGQTDTPVAEARRTLGIHAIIGATANTYEQVEKAYRDGADYVGVGPYRFTKTKSNLAPILGLEGYKQIIYEMRAHNINIPVVAIGGITRDDIPELIRAGVDQIAICGDIINAPDATARTTEIINTIANAKLDYRRS